MNILPIDNSNSFKGALSKKVVRHIKKAERANIMSEVKKANSYGEVLTAEKINVIKDSANNIINNLKTLAEELPQNAKIVLKEKTNGLHVRGIFSDKYIKEDFYVYNPYMGGLPGQLTNSSGDYFSIATLMDQNMLKAKDVKENIALDVRNSIDKATKEGKIKSDKSLQKRYDYYKEEFPIIESYRKRHQLYMEEYANKQQVKNENSKYLPLGQRILQKLGF